MEDEIILYQDKYTKEQFKEKIENTFYQGDYGFEVELKENYADKINFKQDLLLSDTDDDYLMLDYDTGSVNIVNDEHYFGMFLTQLSHFTYSKLQEIESKDKRIAELETALKEIINNPCPLDDIDKKELLRDIKNPCKELCKIRDNCPGKIVRQALKGGEINE